MKPSSETNNTSIPRWHELTPKGKRVVATIATAAVLGTGVTAIYETNGHKSSEAKQAGKEQLMNTQELLGARVVIPAGVHLRKSPELIDGDNSTGQGDNIDYTVPKGKQLTVTYPSFVQGSNGDEFLVLHRPNHSVSDTTLDYVDLSAIAREGNDGMLSVENITEPKGGPLQADSYKNGFLPMIPNVVYIGKGEFQNGSTDQFINNAMVATEQPANS